jgi:serine/threonine-protein kinase
MHLSPDGKRLLVRARGLKPNEPAQVLLRDLAAAHYRPLPLPATATNLLWSPDGRRVLFVASEELKALDIETGGVVLIRDMSGIFRGSPFRGSATNERGAVLMGRNRGSLFQFGPDAAERKETSSQDEIAQSFPGFLPGGRWFYYTSVRTNGASLVVADLDGKEAPRALFEVEGGQVLLAVDPVDATRGLFLYRAGDAISGRWFDLRRRTVEPEAVSVPVQSSAMPDGYLNLSVSIPARVLIQGVAPPTDMMRQLTIFDRKGKVVSELAPPGTAEFAHPQFSPDDKLLLGDRAGDLWVMDVARGVPSRVTFEPGLESPGVIAPDGRTVYYAAQQGSKMGIYRADLTGAGKPVLLVNGDFHHLAVSPDGKELAVENRASDGRQIGIIRLDAPSKIAALATPEKAEPAWPQFSPDGRWLMYISRESGVDQIYVQSHPAGKGKWQVSRDGGTQARWRGDGKEIVFKSPARKLMRVDVRTRGDELEFGMPEVLFETAQLGVNATTSYFAMTSDGQRFAFDRMLPRDPQSAANLTADPVTILVDWMASLPRPGAAR